MDKFKNFNIKLRSSHFYLSYLWWEWPHISNNGIVFVDNKIKNWNVFFKNNMWKTKGMFGNCFFLLFSVFKNNFLFSRLKNLFSNSKWTKNKNCFQNSICEGNWKYTKGCFQFLIFKSQWKHTFNLKNLSHLMS